MTSSSQPAALSRYLARHGFAPSPANPAWLDHDTGHQVVRVLHEPGETTLLYCLAPHSVCLYEAVFSSGTPDAVITAAIGTALRLSSPPGPARPGPGRPRAGSVREGKREPR